MLASGPDIHSHPVGCCYKDVPGLPLDPRTLHLCRGFVERKNSKGMWGTPSKALLYEGAPPRVSWVR